MSIPKIAMFYWSGGELPWLRAQSIASFVRLHPGWDVVLASPEPREPPAGARLVLDRATSSKLPPAARSDAFRWDWLADHGGFYADTDVLFVRPVGGLFSGREDAWITTDVGTSVPGTGAELSIGVLAAQPGSAFFARAAAYAARLEPGADYQSHGTKLLASRWANLVRGCRLGEIPARAFYRRATWRDHSVRGLWEVGGGGSFDPDELGLHYYAGSPASAPFLDAAGVEDVPAGSWVRRALEGAPGAQD